MRSRRRGLDRRTMLRSRAPRSGLTKWLRRRSTAEPSYVHHPRAALAVGAVQDHVAVRARRVGSSPERADQLLAVGRVDHVVVEVDERELGVHPVEQEVHVPEPALLLAVGVDLHPVVVAGVRPADLLGAVVGPVDRHEDALRLVGLRRGRSAGSGR